MSAAITPPIYVVDDGGDYWLECWAGTRSDQPAVVRVCQIEPGDTWDVLATTVAAHQADHGCGP